VSSFIEEVRMAGRLERYRSKRNFQVTSEPAPGKVKPRKAGRATFMVHKHDASHLHYDLRLEIHGVLASWAVPKGPSLDPSIRRLAMQTEDHPLEYGKFEGRIPDGQYGAGDSLIWDRGTFDTDPPGQAAAQLVKGHLVLELHGEKLQGRWHLVRTRPQGGKAAWLLFKGHDAFASTEVDLVTARPESVKSGKVETRGPTRPKRRTAMDLLLAVWPPMLATLSEPDELAKPADYVLELKYDGFRAISALAGGQVSMQSRNARDLGGRFPQIAAALRGIPAREVVLDGEVIALGEGGASRFQALQTGEAEHRYAVFDLLWLNGEDLRAQPLERRRSQLEELLRDVDLPIELAKRVRGPIEAALTRAKREGEEGLIAKRKGSRYLGARTRDWLKLKVSASQELAIVGFTPISNGAAQVGALLLGVREPGGFRYAGKVGTGFDDATRSQLFRTLQREVTDAPPVLERPRMRDARWVRPSLVAQVAFTEWTRDSKLRHPRFQGLRDDKSPDEVVREQKGERRVRPAMAAHRRRR